MLKTLVLGLFLTVASIQPTTTIDMFKSEERIHYIKTEFTVPMADAMIATIKKADKKDILIDINSPGGEIQAEVYLTQAMRKSGHVDTLVTFMAASAAAQTFLAGANRYVEPTALILFHGASLNGQTAGMLRKQLVVTDSKHESAQIEAMLTILDTLNINCLREWEPIIKASNGKLTAEMVIKTFYNNYEKDVFVSGKTLIDLGIAQDASLINYDKYK